MVMKKADDIYIQRLRKMRPAQRLLIALELTDIVNKIAICGICKQYPKLSQAAARKKLFERIFK